MDLFKLVGTIAINNTDANNAIDDTTDKAEKSHGKMSEVFGKIGGVAVKAGKAIAVGIGAGATALTAISKTAIEDYANYEQLVGGVETLFKGSSDKVVKYANDAYKTAGLSANDYMETVTSFSASLLQSLGGDTEKASEKANQALVDMSDNANKMGSSMESIQLAYQGFAKQNYTMLDNLKLGYGGTKEEMQRLLEDAEKISGIHYDISSFSDVTDAIHVMQESMGIAGTTAKEASSTIQGSIGMMKSAWTNFLTGMADPTQDFDALLKNLVDSIVTVANNLVPRIANLLPRLVEGITQLVQTLGGYIPDMLGELLPALIDGATQLMNGLVATLPALIQTIVNVLPQFIQAVTQIFNGVVQALPSLMQTIVDAIPQLIPQLINGVTQMIVSLANALPQMIQVVVTALPTIIQSIVQALTTNLPILIQGLMDMINGIVQALPQIIQAILDALPTIITMLIQTITDSLPMLIDGLIQLMQSIVTALPQIIQALVDAIPTIITTLVNGLVTALPQLLDGLVQLVMAIVENLPIIIQSLVTALPTIITTIVSTLIENLPTLIEGCIQLVIGIVSALPQIIMALIQAIPTIITSIIQAFIPLGGQMKDVATNVMNGVKTTFSNVWNGIKTTVSNVINRIKSVISGGLNGAKNTVSNVLNGIKSKFSSIFNGAKDIVSGAINKIKGFFNFSWSLPKLKMPHFSISGSFSLNPPSIPHIGVDWYKKAMDEPYMFKDPTLFGFNPATGTAKGAGEAGDEMMYGRSNLMDDIGQAVATQNGSIVQVIEDMFNKLFDILEMYFPEFTKSLVLDTGVLVAETAEQYDDALGIIKKRKERG